MWKKIPIVLAALLGLTACSFEPPQSHTYMGKACHPVGYSWSPIWVSPDGRVAC
jgi:hypothetical protein